jgi:hypothetical protein
MVNSTIKINPKISIERTVRAASELFQTYSYVNSGHSCTDDTSWFYFRVRDPKRSSHRASISILLT